MNLSEAARVVGVSGPAMHHWVKKCPEMFERGSSGWNITADNLAKLPIKRRAQPAPRPKHISPPPPRAERAHTPPAPVKAQPRPAPSGPPSIRQGEVQVGWWCKRCDGLMPMANRYCRCLDGTERMPSIEVHKKTFWKPMYVHMVVTLGAEL